MPPSPSRQPSVMDVDDGQDDYETAITLPHLESSREQLQHPQQRSPPRQSPAASPQRDDQLTSLAGIIGVFIDHLECAIHTILYERDIYPQQVFMAARKYNCPVRMCRVPKVNKFIRNTVERVREQLLQVWLSI
jgi:hypothetical protein